MPLIKCDRGGAVNWANLRRFIICWCCARLSRQFELRSRGSSDTGAHNAVGDSDIIFPLEYLRG